MIFITRPQRADDIRTICAHFNEGIRVEYKSTLDENVRRALPKVLSSFANSLGGVLIIGVQALNGIPQEPIEGFQTLAEELPLTIENICLQGTHPPVFPRVHVIASDIAGRSFLVIEIDESWEAPHAIENSTKVYVRTGNAANPYQLANVDLIIELLRRRAEPTAKRHALLETAQTRARTIVDEGTIHLNISLSPPYPRHALCTREDCWDFITTSRYRGAHYFPFETLRRVEDGIASYNRDREYAQVSRDGVLFLRSLLEIRAAQHEPGAIRVADILHPILRLMHCATTFYERLGYGGDLTIELGVYNVRLQRLQFLRQAPLQEMNDFQCLEHAVAASETTTPEQLAGALNPVIKSLIRQLCWSFWQAPERFPSEALDRNIDEFLQQMGFR